jgi:hypothetical protein
MNSRSGEADLSGPGGTGSSNESLRSAWFRSRRNINVYVSSLPPHRCPLSTSQCPTCPDPHTCARLLEEKWRHGYQSLFRFGPAQPSMVFRYLRSLEGVGPPLALRELACQNHAKQWTATRELVPPSIVRPAMCLYPRCETPQFLIECFLLVSEEAGQMPAR